MTNAVWSSNAFLFINEKYRLAFSSSTKPQESSLFNLLYEIAVFDVDCPNIYESDVFDYSDFGECGRTFCLLLSYRAYIVILVVIPCVKNTVWALLVAHSGEDPEHWHMGIVFHTYLWSSFFQRIMIFLINLRQTRWPVKMFQDIIHHYSTRRAALLAHTDTLAKIASESMDAADSGVDAEDKTAPTRQSTKARDDLRMYDLLTVAKAFDLFIAHCSAEHATGRVPFSFYKFTRSLIF